MSQLDSLCNIICEVMLELVGMSFHAFIIIATNKSPLFFAYEMGYQLNMKRNSIRILFVPLDKLISCGDSDILIDKLIPKMVK